MLPCSAPEALQISKRLSTFSGANRLAGDDILRPGIEERQLAPRICDRKTSISEIEGLIKVLT